MIKEIYHSTIKEAHRIIRLPDPKSKKKSKRNQGALERWVKGIAVKLVQG